MSSENSSKVDVVKNIGSSIVGLQKDNPKLFYGGIVVLFLAFLFLLTGSEPEDAPQMNLSLVKGQTYIVKNPNGGSVLLLAKPMLGSADSGDEMNVCLVEPGTPAQYTEQTIVSYLHFVKVTVTSGECQGKSGWTSKINISQ